MSKAAKLAPISIEQLQPMAISLAQRLARSPDEVDDLVQVALFAVYKDMQRILDEPRSETEGNHRGRQPYSLGAWKALARTTLRRAMWSYYDSPDERVRAQTQSVDTVPWLALSSAESQVDLLELSEYFAALERQCGPLARTIAENLVAPGDACSAAIAGEVQRKRRRREAYSQRAPRARVSHKLMRMALGISKGGWTRELRQIRTFTRGWLA